MMYHNCINNVVVHPRIAIAIFLIITPLSINTTINIHHISVRQGGDRADNCVKIEDPYTKGIKTCCDSKYEHKNSIN